MKAISLTQPWASLIALGYKRIETRSWSTTYRGPLAIHATSGFPLVTDNGKDRVPRIGESLEIGPFEVERDRAGLILRGDRLAWPYRLPMGAVVATCELVQVTQIKFPPEEGMRLRYAAHPDMPEWTLTDLEISLGDYRPGRYAWLLHGRSAIRHPKASKGALGLWEWDE